MYPVTTHYFRRGAQLELRKWTGVRLWEAADIYSTQEPQAAFHARIAFCLDTHNEAVKVGTYTRFFVSFTSA